MLICSFLLTLFISTFLILFLFSLILFILLTYFFRDPERFPPSDEDLVLSPADGYVYSIESSLHALRIRIRMSLFNVHVNRVPFSGKITSITRYTGAYWPFLPFLRRGSERNAHQIIQIQGKHLDFEVVQISGMLARRCVCYKREDDMVIRGSRLGIIRLGSEVDLVFPRKDTVQILVKKGDKVKAGETPAAKLVEVSL